MPIVEPEILMDGDHDLKRAIDVATIVLTTVYQVCIPRIHVTSGYSYFTKAFA